MTAPFDDADIQRRCLACKYPLDHLTESRCPECGRTFLPGDASTYLLAALDGPRCRAARRFWAGVTAVLTLDFFLYFGVMRFLPAGGMLLLTGFHAILMLVGFLAGMTDDPIIQRIGIAALILGAFPFVFVAVCS